MSYLFYLAVLADDKSKPGKTDGAESELSTDLLSEKPSKNFIVMLSILQ